MAGIDREEMISVATYYRDENRHPGRDDSLASWLSGEEEIDAILKNYKHVKIHYDRTPK
ncbi:MAG: hypothetical protein AWT59_2770 [Candidatus Gallionella acididurans]|uniref:Uncharacterized protein n=1 Tax=Candidatus Gallionella acididurans TaxID=1796491 RepID=A0A139BQ34_9PROT|nr:MAG: hypothetical protein AWT59_2770 [Candidatus Gallionella acididurans]